MSRSEEMYQFVGMDSDDIYNGVLEAYRTLTGKSRPTGPDLLFCKLLAYLVLADAANTNYAANQNLASRASGANLDALAEIYNDESRPAETYAGVTLEFTLSEAQEELAIIVPAGTRVADENLTIYFTTDTDLEIPPGETTGTVHATCETIGKAGNDWPVDSLTKLVDVFQYYDSVTNTTVSDGGADVPTDDEYYELLLQSQDAYSTCGAEGAYIYFAKLADTEISDVVVNSPYDGEVYIYCLMNNGNRAGAEVKSLVESACRAKDRRPLTDKVTVYDPGYVNYTITMTYYIPKNATSSATAIANAVTDAVNDYVKWQCGKLGRDIVPDELVARVIGAGAKRCVITSPVYNVLQDGIIDYSDYDPDTDFADTIPQIAHCTAINLTNGGIEDE